MTNLDDGLNTSAPVWLPPNLSAVWDEANPDPNRDVLDEQMTGEFTVNQSIDDGLPDPVTMTTSNDASGTLSAPLIGRGNMQDARKYFSPFNASSPVYGYERDVAPVSFTQNTLTPVGPVGTQLFQGQMADVTIQSGVASLDAVSKTRLDLDGSLILPMVRADRENLSVDWLATWAMARGGQYVGPAPSRYTRYWAPLYGSAHAHFESIYSYSGASFWNNQGASSFKLRFPKSGPGPFMTAMYGSQTDTEMQEIFLSPMRLDLNREKGLLLPGDDDTDWPFYDQMSLANSAGRMTFWVLGTPIPSAPSYLTGNDDLRFRYQLSAENSSGGLNGYMHFQINSGTGVMEVMMGSDLEGFRKILFGSQVNLPSDNQWHFVGVKWDFAAGVAEINMDGTTLSSNGWSVTGENNTGLLPATEDAHIAAGGKYNNFFRSHAGFSDVILEAGPQAWSDSWARNYPLPAGRNAIARPTYQPLVGLAEPAPIQGWELLTKLAQSALVSYRVNEQDNFEWLPQSYFGETAQQTATTVMDTEVNAQDLDVKSDPSKARNVVTVQFPDTMADGVYSPCLQLTSAVEIPRGPSVMTFTLDTPITEIHGALNPFSSVWTLTNLNATQIAAGAGPSNVHYITANTSADGSGTVVSGKNIDAKILSYTSSTVTIQFRNILSTSGWLANNFQGDNSLPALRILGYAIRSTDGYVTERDPGSIGVRRERALDSELPWIQDRTTAQKISSALISTVSHPRAEVDVVVMGDPRRKPGDLVTLADAQTTQAAGRWRVTSVEHNGAGAEYTQKLHLVSVLPLGVWDVTNWDESIWGE